MLGIGIVSTALLFFLKEPVVNHGNPLQKSIIEAQKSHMGSHIQGPAEVKTEKPSLKEGLLKLWRLSLDKRFMRIIPQTVWTGCSIAYFSGNLVQMLQ
jgi:hypothetical protein